MFDKFPLTELIVIAVVLKILSLGVSFSDALAVLFILVALNFTKFLPDKKQSDLDEIVKRLDEIERTTTVLKMRHLK